MRKRILAAVILITVLTILSPAVLAAETAGSQISFSDVKETDWYADSVSTAVGMGLINGKGKDASGQDYFDPKGYITLAEAVKLAACMNQLYSEGAVTLTNGDPWYESYADYGRSRFLMASEAGFSYESVMGSPDYVLRRAEFAWLFARALPSDALPEINTVPNDSIPDMRKDARNLSDSQNYLLKYYTEVYSLYRAGIVNGSDGDGTFLPGSNIRRCEVAAIVVRMMLPEKRVGAPENLHGPSAGITLAEIYEANLLSNIMKRHSVVTTRLPGESGSASSYWIDGENVAAVSVWDYTQDGVTVHHEQGTYGDFGFEVTDQGQVAANLWVSGSGHMPMDDVLASALPVELTEEIRLISSGQDIITVNLKGLFQSGPSAVPGEMTLEIDKNTHEFRSYSVVWNYEDGYTYSAERVFDYDSDPVGKKITEGWDRTRTITYDIHPAGAEPRTETFVCPAAWDLTLTPLPGYNILVSAPGAEAAEGDAYHVSPGTDAVAVTIE